MSEFSLFGRTAEEERISLLDKTVCDNNDTSERLEHARSAVLDITVGMNIALDERPGDRKTISTPAKKKGSRG